MASAKPSLMTSYLVIFGAAVRPDGEPSGTLRRRVEGAVAAARGRSGVCFLCSGGMSAGGHVEADIIRRMQLAHGIPETAILLEREGRDTLHQVRLCDALLRGRSDVDEVIPCTSRYHIPRCAVLLRTLGWPVRIAPMPGDLGLLPWRKLLWYYCKEVVALLLRSGVVADGAAGQQTPGRYRVNRWLIILAGLVAAAVLVAGFVWWQTGHSGGGTPAENALEQHTRQAEAYCLANTDLTRDGKVSANGEHPASGIGVTAEVGSHEVSKRGAGDRVPQNQVVDENDKIRACMEKYAKAHGAP